MRSVFFPDVLRVDGAAALSDLKLVRNKKSLELGNEFETKQCQNEALYMGGKHCCDFIRLYAV
jgi:hypothetical protein